MTANLVPEYGDIVSKITMIDKIQTFPKPCHYFLIKFDSKINSQKKCENTKILFVEKMFFQ